MPAATMTGAHQPLEKEGGTMALRLTIAFTNNPRVQPLKDGTVKPLIFPFCTFSQDLGGFPLSPSCNLFTFNHL